MTQNNQTLVDEKHIPKGYKKTEVGVIPSDWDVKKLGDISSIYSGGTPNRKVGEYWGGLIPWVTTTLINGGEIKEAQEYITSKGYENSSAKWCEKETILMAMYGQGKTRGKVGKLVFGATINQACAAIKVDDKYNVNYILSFLNSKYEAIRDLSNAGGQENLSGNIVKSISILIPSLNEQQKIATALSDTDTLISELEKLIEKKRAIKTATMQQLLTGKTRLPEFALREAGTAKGYIDTELGQIPEDWLICNLEELMTYCSSGATPYRGNTSFYKGDIRWITSGELNYCVIDDTLEKISSDAVKKTNLKLHPTGTFLMAITGLEAEGTRGSCGIVGKPSTTNQSCMAIYTNKLLETSYLYNWYVLNGNNLALKYCQGTKQMSYTAALIKKIPIYCPSNIEEQNKISEIFSSLDIEIKNLALSLDKLKNIKQGMMQELLTGKTRLV